MITIQKLKDLIVKRLQGIIRSLKYLPNIYNFLIISILYILNITRIILK